MSMRRGVAVFGEAERGDFGIPLFTPSVLHLNERFGHPPHSSQGIFLAIQFLMSEQHILYVRVKEEGFSLKDYSRGAKNILNKREPFQCEAVCLPGVGDREIIDFVDPILKKWDAILVTTAPDLYDYLTSFCFTNR